MQKLKIKILAWFLVILLPLTALGCKGASTEVKKVLKPVTLEVWGTYLDSDEITPLLQAYRQSHPYVTINYKRFRPEEYEDELINALAEDRGPDIFMIPNTKVQEYKNKIVPLPSQIKLPVVKIEGSLKKEEKIVMETKQSLSPSQLRKAFVKVVADDVILKDSESQKEEIYALPLDMDTLVLYYNEELLDRANIPEPPKTWVDLQNIVPALTKFDEDGNIVQSAINLGRADNISNYFDLLSVLMMQNGTVMVGQDDNQIHFHEMPSALKGKVDELPAVNALDFYTSFAKNYKVNYTWDEYLAKDVEEFAAGNLAMFIGYKYHDKIIKSLSPKLKYSVAPLPQINPEYPTNYAKYWAFVVAKKSEAQKLSWDLLQTIASKNYVQKYLKNSNRITVLRSLINEQKQNENLAVWVDQILSARSWYRGKYFEKAQKEFADMINTALGDNYKKLSDVVSKTAYKIMEFYNR